MSENDRLKATDYQRLPLRVVNAILRGANAMGLARVSMDAEELMARARKATGLYDFGDERFIEPLRVLVRSTNEEADLNPLGRWLAKSNIQRVLQARLRAQDLFERYPEILAREMPDPVVVVGLGRSGTTRLHRLLAADGRFLHLKSWESVYPVPDEACFAARAAGQPDPRITAVDQALRAVHYASPQVAAVHPLGTLEVEEEIGLLQHAFASQLWELINELPTFAEYLMTHDQRHAYAYMVDLLKLVSWFRGDPPDKPWVLKTPQHMQDLDSLLHVFPNARLVCPHRDPIKAVGSVCSTVWNSLVRDNDHVDPHSVGELWLTKTERMLHKNLADRERLCPPQNQYDILYADISSDWEGAMGGVYDFLGLPLTDAARAGMRAWLDRNRQHKHGAHKYSLADFGLDENEVDRRLMFYRERFNIPYETRNPHLAAARQDKSEVP